MPCCPAYSCDFYMCISWLCVLWQINNNNNNNNNTVQWLTTKSFTSSDCSVDYYFIMNMAHRFLVDIFPFLLIIYLSVPLSSLFHLFPFIDFRWQVPHFDFGGCELGWFTKINFEGEAKTPSYFFPFTTSVNPVKYQFSDLFQSGCSLAAKFGQYVPFSYLSKHICTCLVIFQTEKGDVV